MVVAKSHTVTITIRPDPNRKPTHTIEDIPWFPGITVLEAMIIGEAMSPKRFSFRAVYASFYGAFIDQIDNLADQGGKYWMLYINAKSSNLGASEAIVLEDPFTPTIKVEWKYELLPTNQASQKSISMKKAASKL